MSINAKSTVVELKAAAKARGFKRYSKLRKPELLQLLGVHTTPVNNNDVIPTPAGDSSDNMSTTPVNNNDVIPTPAGDSSDNMPTTPVNNLFDEDIPNIIEEPVRLYFGGGIPNIDVPVLTPTSNTAKKFEIQESKSAIKGFAKQYTINGAEGVDAASFLNTVGLKVCNFLSNN